MRGVRSNARRAPNDQARVVSSQSKSRQDVGIGRQRLSMSVRQTTLEKPKTFQRGSMVSRRRSAGGTNLTPSSRPDSSMTSRAQAVMSASSSEAREAATRDGSITSSMSAATIPSYASTMAASASCRTADGVALGGPMRQVTCGGSPMASNTSRSVTPSRLSQTSKSVSDCARTDRYQSPKKRSAARYTVPCIATRCALTSEMTRGRLPCGPTAFDEHVAAGGVRRRVRREEQRCADHFVGVHEPAHRRLSREPLDERGLVVVGDAVRRDAIHAHAALGPVCAEVAREHDDAALARGVRDRIAEAVVLIEIRVRRNDAVRRGDVDDAALSLLEHHGAEIAAREDRARAVHGDDRVPQLLWERLGLGV